MTVMKKDFGGMWVRFMAFRTSLDTVANAGVFNTPGAAPLRRPGRVAGGLEIVGIAACSTINVRGVMRAASSASPR